MREARASDNSCNKALRNWRGKYDAAHAQAQQIAKKLEGAIALQYQKTNQIGQ